jgi:radical SAM protein with 4Fe4S-binding SPASM domain
MWDGTVSACCADQDHMMVVGNIKDNTIREIWKGKKMNDYRRMILEGRYCEVSICDDCYDLGAT